MTDNDNERYITIEEAANQLKLSYRQAARYAEKVRTRKTGKRIMFHAGDVEQLAKDMQVEYRPPLAPRSELVPISETLKHISHQEERIATLSHELGRLQGILSERDHRQQVLTLDIDDTKARLAAVEAERDRLKAELARVQERPWWMRFFDGSRRH
jgi:uncharacterized small protein (DUF1192 family)